MTRNFREAPRLTADSAPCCRSEHSSQDPLISYVYKRPVVRFLVDLYDRCGGLVRRRPSPTIPPRHVCAIVLNQIGDAVMALPTIDAVAHIWPETRLTVIAGRGVASLLRARAWRAEVREFDALWQKVVRQLLGRARNPIEIARSMTGFRRLMREVRPDVAIAFQPDLVLNGLLGSTGLGQTFGFVEAGSGFWLKHPVTMPTTGHQSARLFALAAAFARALNVAPPRLEAPQLELGGERVRDILARLGAAGIDRGRLVVLHPFASAETKNWPTERWRSLADWLRREGWAPIVVGGERDDIESSAITSSVNLPGALDLPDLAALLSVARLFVGVDSGPGHVAAAVGCPVVTIFSSVNDVERWRPREARAPVAVLHKPVQDRRRFPYEMRTLPPNVAGNPYVDQISVDDVIAEIRRLTSTGDRQRATR